MKPLHTIIITILLVVGALFWHARQQQERYDAEAQKYVAIALRDISSWQGAPLQNHLAEQARAAIDDAQLDALTERYRGLGRFRRTENLQFAHITAALSMFSSNILLSYHGNAVFENGSASLAITLLVNDNRFRIYNFSLGNPQINALPGSATTQ